MEERQGDVVEDDLVAVGLVVEPVVVGPVDLEADDRPSGAAALYRRAMIDETGGQIAVFGRMAVIQDPTGAMFCLWIYALPVIGHILHPTGPPLAEGELQCNVEPTDDLTSA